MLRTCSIGDDGARTLFAADNLAGLEALDVSQCRIAEADTLQALRQSHAMSALVDLAIAGNNALGGHLGTLAGWEVLPRLTRLALPQTIAAEELKALFPKPSASLRELDLSSAKQLLKTPAVVHEAAEAFTSLDLGGTSIGDDGWAALLAAASVGRVVHLFANGCSLSDAAVTALTASKLRRLVTLDLSSNKLTDKGLQALAAWPGIEHVTHLRIGNNRKVTAAGYEALIAATALQLGVLDIGKSSDRKLEAKLRERFGRALIAT